MSKLKDLQNSEPSNVREVTKKDFSRLVNLNLKIADEQPFFDRYETVTNVIEFETGRFNKYSKHPNYYLVLTKDKLLNGYARLEAYKTKNALFEFSILNCYNVDDNYKLLLDAIIEKAKIDKINKLSIFIEDNNTNMIKFLETNNFKTILKLKEYNAIKMSLTLT